MYGCQPFTGWSENRGQKQKNMDHHKTPDENSMFFLVDENGPLTAPRQLRGSACPSAVILGEVGEVKGTESLQDGDPQ
jgi:hypothetical protein